MKTFFTLLFLLFFTKINGQQAEPDTLKPELQIQSDSTKTDEEEMEDEEGEDGETEEEKDDSPTPFRYRISADGTVTSGNINRALMQIATGFDWDLHEKVRISTSPSYIYGKQSGLLNERELFADLRTSILHERKLYYLAFTSVERSNLRKINHRYIGAAGIGLKIIQKKNAYLSLTNVLLYEKTDFVSNENFADRNLWRNSTRFFGEYKFDKNKITISHLLFLQPSISEKNVRWNGNLIFKYQISKVASIRTTIENSYESIVVPNRQNNDFRLTFGIVLEGRK